MKKRLFSLLLVFSLLIGLLPVNILASSAPATSAAGYLDLEEGAPEDPAGEVSPSEGSPSENEPSENAPSENAPSENAPSENAPSENAPSEDPAQEEAASEEDASEEDPLGQTRPSLYDSAEDYEMVSSEAEFLAMSANKNYRLASDITVSSTYSKTFTGKFDGDGHTITLNIAVSSGYYVGLFSQLGSGALIENVKLSGSVSSSGGYTYAMGALVGKIVGAATVKNCSSSASVTYTGKYSSAATGGLIGSVAGSTTLSSCSASGDVTVSGGYGGGLIGMVTSTCSVTNCEARGDVTATGAAAGGFVGSVSLYSGTASFSGCTALGAVSGPSEKTFGFLYYQRGTCTIEDCLYNPAQEVGCNQAFDGLAPNVSDDARFTVTLTVSPANASVSWDGTVLDANSTGVYTITNVAPKIAHTCIVTPPEDADKESVTETFKVFKNTEKTITCLAKTYTLSFTNVPTDATLTLKDALGAAVSANADKTYTVPSGSYTYTLTGSHVYADISSAALVIDRQNKAVDLPLTERPYRVVRFSCDDAQAKFTVSYASGSSSKTVAPEADGSYKLHAGCVYTWLYTGESYIDQSGTLDLTALLENDTQTIEIAKSLKPQKDADGYYQIVDAPGLFWMAAQINSGTYTNHLNDEKFALAADIDLSGSAWTPIGQSGSYTAFKGTFDGRGHTISGLSITNGSYTKNQGLFGYVDGGSIKNVTVSGSIQVTGNSTTTSYGAGGIVGNLTGSGSVIENCVNHVTVTGGQNAGGIAGIVSGSSAKTIRNCANLADITTNGIKAGGIAGYVSGNVTIEACYNAGAIKANGAQAGGIAANLSSSSASIKTCYSYGAVSATSSANAIVGYRSSGSVEKASCFYPETLSVTDGNATALSVAALQAVPEALQEAFVAAPAGKNNGYPLLSFQIATYPVTITVSPANAVVTISGQSGSVADGVWHFDLSEGDYAYTVSAFGYSAQTGTLHVTASGENALSVTLLPGQKRTITFSITPSGLAPEISVFYNGAAVTPEADGSYLLPDGEYSYAIKAKGYARVTSTLQVTKDQTVSITLIASSAWDGASTSAPAGLGTESSPYLIDTPEELAWFANYINTSASVKSIYAALTDDIDLGGMSWTAIGKSFHEFSGSFDGRGHTVSGLKVENQEHAGLFGAAKDAVFQNVVIRGAVSGTANVGGLVGKLSGSGSIQNCGNESSITAASSTGANAGGLVGSTTVSLTGCYNTGAVSSTGSESYSRAGGLVGHYNGSSSTILLLDCYNTGRVTSSAYAGALAGAGADAKNCYSVGAVLGLDGKTYAFTTASYADFTNCYFLQDPAVDSHAMTLYQMMTRLYEKLGTENWKVVAGKNQELPVLSWQRSYREVGGSYKSAKNIEFVTEEVYSVGSDGLEAVPLSTPVLTWSEDASASGYFISIWEQSIDLDPDSETYGQMMLPVLRSAAQVASGKTRYDCASLLPAREGVYYAAVSIISADGTYQMPTADVVADEIVGWQLPYDRMAQITGLTWDGDTASWDLREGFTDDEDCYLVMLYSFDANADVSPENRTYTFVTSDLLAGDVHEVRFRNAFAADLSYVFTVSALSSLERQITTGLNDSLSSGFSPAYCPSASSAEPEEWIYITSAEQWLEIANTPDTFVDSSDSSSGSLQAKVWSQNYKLQNDLDFSNLSAEDAAKTKSIGTVDYNFCGTLDGNGKKITGLTLSNNDCGLFHYIGATGKVKNLTIEGANVLFADNAAILSENNYGTIDSCKIINCNITADNGAVIGPVASRNYGIIRNTYVRGGSLTSNDFYATGHGGFVGANEASGRITSCYTSMSLSTKSDYAGGFVGLGYGGTIKDCFCLGSVSARSYSGGFLGRSVYEGNVYENCYAAGSVTLTTASGDGFLGGNKPDSSFQYTQYGEDNTVKNCYVVSDAQKPGGCGASYIPFSEAKTAAFVTKLGSAWTRDDEKNSALPYLAGLDAPESITTNKITVTLALATYDKTSYTFSQMGSDISVTMDSTGNTRLVDLMDAAVAQGLLTYDYETTTAYGRYIKSINGYAVTAPDGWMFTINDNLSNVSASLAVVKDGDKVLWYEGTTENRHIGPSWESLKDSALTWVNITNAAELRALAASTDAQTLAKNYRLTADIDLGNAVFSGIGTQSAPFTGIFDGQNHTVSNVIVSGTENTGFFGVILGATVKNLKLTNLVVTGGKQVGGLVGKAAATLDKTDLSKNVASLVGNCSVSGAVTGSESVGGLVGLNMGVSDTKTGFSSASSIHNSSFTGSVSGAGSKLGGLVGENSANITESLSSGSVSAQEANMVGGLVGENSGSIYDSHADAAVTGNERVGGFAGMSLGTVTRCYSLGAVSGAAYTGSFAGSIVDANTALGAGSVTKRVGSSTGYFGGFAGTIDGTLVGIASSITVKNVFGYCEQAEGELLAACGNAASFTAESEKAALLQMQLTTWTQVCQKAKELFDLELSDPTLELSKYEDSVNVAGSVKAGSVISLLKSGQTASKDLSLSLSIQSGSAYIALQDGVITLRAKNETQQEQLATVKLTVTDGKTSASKTVTIHIAVADATPAPEPSEQDAEALMHAIAKANRAESDSWMVFDMTAYATLSGAQAATEKRQSAIDELTALVQSSTSNKESDYSKAEIILANLGVDTGALGASGNFDLPAKLRACDMSQVSHYTAPYVLLANLQGNVDLSSAQITTLLTTLEDNMGEDGMFSYSYAGVTYPSPDTAGAALSALAPLYKTNSQAKHIVDTIKSSIPGQLDASGSFGNANSDAMVIVGLAALGIDAETVTASSGKNLLQGLLSHANEDGTAFQFPNWTTGDAEDNFLATEQGFRALVALMKLREQNGEAYQIYASSNYTPAGVQDVIDLIDAIGTVNSASGSAILAARAAFDKLTSAEQAKVTNVSKLLEAESAYAALLAARKAELRRALAAEYQGYDLDAYSASALAQLQSAYQTGLTDIDAAKTCESAELSYESAVKAMRDVKPGEITVTFRLIGDTDHSGGEHEEFITWVTTTSYSLAENATVADLFIEATSDYGLSSTGASSGYVSAIYAPSVLGGYKLSEFTNGPRSGWMFSVNGKNATVSMTNYTLQNGDAVVWYYTDDYTASSSYPYAADISPEQYVKNRLGNILSVGAHGKASPELTLSSIGKAITFTFTPDNGYRVKDVTVNGVSVGAVTTYRVEKLTFSTRIVVTFTNGALPFTDVLEADWFYDDVVYVYEAGLFSGTSSTTFSPNAQMTRAMLVTVLYRLEGQPAVSGRSGFADVVLNSYYEDAVTWAASNGIVNGTSSEAFSPEAYVTREQMAAILYRYAQYKKYDTTTATALTGFADYALVSAYATTSMQWAVAEKLIGGASGKLMPTGNATRAQVAAILHRFSLNISK